MSWLRCLSKDTHSVNAAVDSDKPTENPMEPMGWLLLLPEELLASLLSDWIDVKDLARLDTAYCSRSKRPGLLADLASCVTQNIEPLCERREQRTRWAKIDGLMAWILQRNICVSAVYVTTCIANYVRRLPAYLQRNGGRIRKVYYNSTSLEIPVKHLESTLELLSQHCPNITNVTCPRSFTAPFSHHLRAWPNLQSITVGAAVTDLDLQFIALNFTHLTRMDGSGYVTATSEGWKQFIEARGAALTHFSTSSWLTENAFVAIAEHCPQLRSLSINWTRTKGALAKMIAQGCPLLQSVNLSPYGATSPDVVLAFAQGCNLRELMFCTRGCGEETINAAIERCAGLRKLSVVIDQMCDIFAVISVNCSQLQELELVWLSAESQMRLNDQLVAIALANKNLLCLRLRGPFSERGSTGVDDSVLMAFAANCPLLTDVTIEGTNGITDAGIIALAQSCRWLRTNRLKTTIVTLVGMRAIAAHCRHIEEVCVVNSPLVAELQAARIFRIGVRVCDR